jgi:hypothetical protein
VATDRLIALLLGLLVIGIGVNGIRIGKVLVKSVRAPAYFSRRKEPVAFWLMVSGWIGFGTFIVCTVLFRKPV